MTSRILGLMSLSLLLCLPLCGCSGEEETTPSPAASTPPAGGQAGSENTPESDPIENEDVREIE